MAHHRVQTKPDLPLRAALSGTVLVVDNFDSFTHILVDYLVTLGLAVVLVRHDAGRAKPLIDQMKPDAVLLSPGPGSPDQAGVCLEMIAYCAQIKLPLIGICLGHQALGQGLGAQVVRAPVPVHGHVEDIWHSGEAFLKGLPCPFQATRYHSLILADIPECLSVVAWTKEGLPMVICHRSLPMAGVQFHPESVGTPWGKELLYQMLHWGLSLP